MPADGREAEAGVSDRFGGNDREQFPCADSVKSRNHIFASAERRPELRTRLRQLYQGMRALFAAGLQDVVAGLGWTRVE